MSDYQDNNAPKPDHVAAKKIGPYKENGYGDISSEWKKHQDKVREMCARQEQEVSTSNNETAANTTTTTYTTTNTTPPPPALPLLSHGDGGGGCGGGGGDPLEWLVHQWTSSGMAGPPVDLTWG